MTAKQLDPSSHGGFLWVIKPDLVKGGESASVTRIGWGGSHNVNVIYTLVLNTGPDRTGRSDPIYWGSARNLQNQRHAYTVRSNVGPPNFNLFSPVDPSIVGRHRRPRLCPPPLQQPSTTDDFTFSLIHPPPASHLSSFTPHALLPRLISPLLTATAGDFPSPSNHQYRPCASGQQRRRHRWQAPTVIALSSLVILTFSK